MDLSTKRLREVVASVELCDVYPDLSADALGVLSHAAIELLRIREAQAGLEPVEAIAGRVNKQWDGRACSIPAEIAAALQRERDVAAARANAPHGLLVDEDGCCAACGRDVIGCESCAPPAVLRALREENAPPVAPPAKVDHGIEWLMLPRTGAAHARRAGAARTICGKNIWTDDVWEPATAQDKRCRRCANSNEVAAASDKGAARAGENAPQEKQAAQVEPDIAELLQIVSIAFSLPMPGKKKVEHFPECATVKTRGRASCSGCYRERAKGAWPTLARCASDKPSLT